MNLDQEFAGILLAMEMLASGSITNYASNGGGVPDSKPPAGVRLDGATELPMHTFWRERWNQAVGTAAKERVFDGATAELEAFRKAPKRLNVVGETEAQLEERIAREGNGWPVEDVARHFKVTVTFVRRARLKASTPVVVDVVDEIERARKLVAEGFTERQIRMLMGCGGSKLERLLGKGERKPVAA